MRILLLAFCIIMFSFNSSLAQVPFAQVNQMPLLMSPSMAGAKNTPRLCLGFNHQDIVRSKENNYAFSYDQIYRNTGAGIGAYGLYRTINENKTDDRQRSLIAGSKDQPHLNMKNHLLIGIAVAPKYNAYSKRNPNKIKYTYSPSYFIEFENDKTSFIDHLKSLDFYTTEFSSQHPEGVATYVHSLPDFVHTAVQGTSIKTGLGFQVNTEKLLVLYKVAYVYRHSKETITHYQYDNNKVLQDLKHQLHSIDQSIHMGYSISNGSDSRFSLTPMIGLGIKNYLNLAPSNVSSNDTLVYSHDLTSKKPDELNYWHGSISIKLVKILVGAAYTHYYQRAYKGLSAGYQSKSIKLMCNATVNEASKINIELTNVICF